MIFAITFLSSLSATGLKSCVAAPCAIIVKSSSASAITVGRFPPPIDPTGPGCIHGDI